MNFLVEYQWEIFIAIEIVSLLTIILFGVVRYLFSRKKLSLSFLLLFILLLVLEGLLALVIYRETGEISTFQIIIIVFIVYACTLGINDFKKLDRWMRQKIGQWRGVNLLTDKDHLIMKRQKDSKHIAKVNRIHAMIHLLIFVIVQVVFWSYGLESINQAFDYIKDLSWIGTENFLDTPYPSDMTYRVSMIWGLVFIIDFVYSWSYTFLPERNNIKD